MPSKVVPANADVTSNSSLNGMRGAQFFRSLNQRGFTGRDRPRSNHCRVDNVPRSPKD